MEIEKLKAPVGIASLRQINKLLSVNRNSNVIVDVDMIYMTTMKP